VNLPIRSWLSGLGKRTFHPLRLPHNLAGLVVLGFLLAGCSPPRATQAMITVLVAVDGQESTIQLAAGSNVQQALQAAGLSLGPLDRVEPQAFTLLGDGAQVRVIRVREEFSVVEEVIPFERQVLQTESLPDQSSLLVQSGENGVQEITYRMVFEDDVEVSRRAVKSAIVKEPQAEVLMVGIRAAHTPVGIPGKLVYLSGSNAWMMEQSTANRRALVTTGDLDGRVLALSDDGNWLLYTRRSEAEEQINALWVADLSVDPVREIDLKVPNIVQFADWLPGSNSKIVFSTVEPRSAAPGWQANNDLYALSFSPSGWTSNWESKPVLEANSGGVYGWWGMNFMWGPDGELLAYARPDGIGLLSFADGILSGLMDVTPLQTGGDWAWVPGLTWGPDGNTLYTVQHATPEVSPIFNLAAIPLSGGAPVELVPQAGMFAYPSASPEQESETGESAYQVAYLQAIFPTQSDTSRYRLVIMDRDGSNPQVLFPQQGEQGLDPQQPAWSPGIMPEGGYAVAVLYKGDLWLVNTTTGLAQQITGDGLISKLTWK